MQKDADVSIRKRSELRIEALLSRVRLWSMQVMRKMVANINEE